jgi:RNA polymerase sigma factor (sigma-70 family)
MRPADHTPAEHSTAGASVAARVTLEELYRANGPFVARFVASLVRRGDGHVVDDLVQETFISAWRGLPGARFQTPGSVQAWLCTIARHTVSTYYRSRAGKVRYREIVTDPTEPTAVWNTPGTATGDDVDRVCLLVDIAVSMSAASAEHRRAVELRVVADQPWHVAASSLRRGKAAVRRLVTEALGEPGAELGVGAVQR